MFVTVIVVIILIANYYLNECSTQAPILFQGIAHTLNPANSLVRYLDSVYFTTSSKNVVLIKASGSCYITLDWHDQFYVLSSLLLFSRC